MIRRPTDHFESVFNGYQLDMLLGIQNSSNPFDEFLSKPKQYLLEYLRKKPRLNIHLNMAKNGITYIHIYTYLLFKCTCIGPPRGTEQSGVFCCCCCCCFFVLFCFLFFYGEALPWGPTFGKPSIDKWYSFYILHPFKPLQINCLKIWIITAGPHNVIRTFLRLSRSHKIHLLALWPEFIYN